MSCSKDRRQRRRRRELVLSQRFPRHPHTAVGRKYPEPRLPWVVRVTGVQYAITNSRLISLDPAPTLKRTSTSSMFHSGWSKLLRCLCTANTQYSPLSEITHADQSAILITGFGFHENPSGLQIATIGCDDSKFTDAPDSWSQHLE
jgi:hypothetical protein